MSGINSTNNNGNPPQSARNGSRFRDPRANHVAEDATRLVNAGLKMQKSVKDGFDVAQTRITRDLNAAQRFSERVSSHDLNGLTIAYKVGRGAAVVAAAAKLPGQTQMALADLKRALHTHDGNDANLAMESASFALRSATVIARGSLFTAFDLKILQAGYWAAFGRLRDAGVSVGEASRLSARAMRLAYEGKPVEEGLAGLAVQKGGTLGKALEGSGARAAKKAAEKTVASAGKAASDAAAKSVAGRLGEAVKRFGPGLSYGLAAFDTVNAIANWRNPEASMARRVTSTVAAAGSIAAATDLPGIREVGAAVSVVSGLLQTFVFTH